MGLADIILRRKSVYKLRKVYDRLREKMDKEPDMNVRLTVLQSLDKIETHIIQLEEGITPDFQKRRLMKYVDESLKKVKRMVKDRSYVESMIKPEKR